jgi:UDPglucose--hexose-1-phosphate uridylyltransferase
MCPTPPPDPGHHPVRRDLVSGAAVRVAPGRGRRIVDPALRIEPESASVSDDEASQCPFCPGNEAALAEIIAEMSGPGPDSWATRAVANLHPAYPPPARHEVLVETPRHHVEPDAFSLEEARAWVALYLGRMAAAWQSAEARHGAGLTVFAFRNRGRDAGASRAHPHGQLWAVPGPVPAHAERENRLRREYETRGACLLCASPDPHPQERTVFADDRLCVEVPWAAVEPFHMRLRPRRHLTSWTQAGEGEREALARLFPPLVATLRKVAGDPAWNLTFHDFGPVSHPGVHAHLEILPRFSRIAGFELASGVRVNEGDPRRDAAALRRALHAHLDLDDHRP